MGLGYKILSLPKTIFFNFYYLPVKQAIKLPIFVSHKCKIAGMGSRKALHLKNKSTGTVRIGVSDGSFCIGSKDISYWNIAPGGNVFFEDKCYFGRGARISVGKNAELKFGKNFVANAKCTISACKNVTFGDGCLLGRECTIIDGDGHKIVDASDRSIKNYPQQVVIGNNVWLASNVTVLKGTVVSNNSIVSAHSCISKKFTEENLLIGGTPGKILRSNVTWEHDGFK